MPSKNEISSARVAYLVRHAAEYGWTIDPPAIDMAVVRRRKREMVEAQVAKHLENYKASGAELLMGSGRLVAPKTIEVRLNDGNKRLLAGRQVFINVGTHAAIPDIPGLEAAQPLTHIEALELDYLPPHLIVLGGGYVGLEFAQAYRRFGSRVTVIEQGPQLMGREDRDVADEIQRILSGEGIEFLIRSEVIAVDGRSGQDVGLTVRTQSGERTSMVATFWWLRDVCRTRTGSDSKRRASNSTRAAISASTSGWKQMHLACGRSANAPEVRNSLMCRRTISASSGIISPAASAAHATGSCLIACSPTRRLLMWA